MLYTEITKKSLNIMVVKFYTKILQDELVGSFFIEKLGDNLGTHLWKTHIEQLTNFWASMTLGDSAYKGNPFAPHAGLMGLTRETFKRWLQMFFETVESMYEPEIAEMFRMKSTFIAGNFMRNLRL